LFRVVGLCCLLCPVLFDVVVVVVGLLTLRYDVVWFGSVCCCVTFWLLLLLLLRFVVVLLLLLVVSVVRCLFVVTFVVV